MKKVPWINKVVGNSGSVAVQAVTVPPNMVDSSSWLHRPIPGILPRGQSDAMRHSTTFHGIPSKTAQAA